MALSRIFIFILIIFCSCHATENNKIDHYRLIQEKKVVLDETALIHKSMPISLQLINDTTLACMSDYTAFAVYNIETGYLVKHINLNDLLNIPSTYKVIDDFIDDELQPYYDDRKYSTNNPEEIPIPRIRADRILLAEQKDDITVVNLLVDIALRYEQHRMIDGKVQLATMYEYLPSVVSIRLSDDEVLNIQPIHAHRINENSKEHTLYAQTQLGGVLTKNNTLILPLTSDLNNYTISDELIAFDLTNKKTKPYSFNQQYPAEMANNPIKWLPRKYFHYSDDGNLYYNSLFTIYEIKGATVRLVISLDSLLNKVNYERIGSFAKLKNDLFLLKVIGLDSMQHGAYGKYVFYAAKQNSISASVLDFSPKNASQNFLIDNNKIIFISSNLENFYIEQFEIVQD